MYAQAATREGFPNAKILERIDPSRAALWKVGVWSRECIDARGWNSKALEAVLAQRKTLEEIDGRISKPRDCRCSSEMWSVICDVVWDVTLEHLGPVMTEIRRTDCPDEAILLRLFLEWACYFVLESDLDGWSVPERFKTLHDLLATVSF